MAATRSLRQWDDEIERMQRERQAELERLTDPAEVAARRDWRRIHIGRALSEAGVPADVFERAKGFAGGAKQAHLFAPAVLADDGWQQAHDGSWLLVPAQR